MSAAMQARALPWLLVLPALVFATPLSPLGSDPYPHLSGAGLALVLLVPLALSLLVRGAGSARVWPFWLAGLWALLAWRFVPLSDGLEARRALCVLAVLPLAFTGGAALDARGRRVFAALLVALSCLWTGGALLLGLAGESLAGLLGDTGSLSQAALPGAAVAAAWLAREHGARRLAGALALFLFLLHVGAAPVLAGAHTLLAALLLGAWRGPARGRGALLALALTALLAPFAGMAVRQALHGTAPRIEGASAERAHSLGGLGVRARVWSAALGLIAAHPFAGAGPGQFQASFPPFRDAREIERSRHGVCSELDTEVEHAHNDWLQGFCELGLVGGALLALGLWRATRDGLRALADDERLPLALAGLALLVNAFVHAPLLANPGASALALAVFGALAPPAPRARLWAGLVALPSLLALPLAPALITHGAALREYIASARRIDELTQQGPADAERAALALAELERARAVVAIALAAAPDSAPARELAARTAREGQALAAWERVLAVRPHSVGAWEHSAEESLRAGRFEEARARYRHALALSPTHPRLLRNGARLEYTRGAPERGAELLALLQAGGCLEPEWATALGCELVLAHGLPARGARLLFGCALEQCVPEELHALARGQDSADEDSPRAAAGECLAQLLWARAHAQAQAFEPALRNYRQAAERSHAWRGAPSGPAPLFALELAAAEARAGRRDEALARTRGLVPAADTWAELPPWARETLDELGLVPGE